MNKRVFLEEVAFELGLERVGKIELQGSGMEGIPRGRMFDRVREK